MAVDRFRLLRLQLDERLRQEEPLWRRRDPLLPACPAAETRRQLETRLIGQFNALVTDLLRQVQLRFYPLGEIRTYRRPEAGVVMRWYLYAPEPLRRFSQPPATQLFKPELYVDLLIRGGYERAALKAQPGDEWVEQIVLSGDEWSRQRIRADEGQPYFRCTLVKLRGDIHQNCAADPEALTQVLLGLVARRFNLRF